MNALTVLLTDDEKGMIANELGKLYSLQDRPLSDEKKAHLVFELSNSGLPFKAIIMGLRSLFAEDLKKISLAEILAACRSKVMFYAEQEAPKKIECEHCYQNGAVMMKDPNGYEFPFSCTCLNAKKKSNWNLIRWGGQPTQIVKGKVYTIPERFLVRAK